MLHLLLQLFLEELTLCAGLLVLCSPVGVLVFQARQRVASGVAMVPEIQLLLHYRHAAKFNQDCISQLESGAFYMHLNLQAL